MTTQQIRKLAKECGWVEEKAKDPTVMIFNRVCDGVRQQVNIWHTRMTVGTYLKHPKMGKSQLFRKGVYEERELRKILDNPRTHTGYGYYTRG